MAETGSVENIIEQMEKVCRECGRRDWGAPIAVMRGIVDYMIFDKIEKIYTPQDLKRLFDAMEKIVRGEPKED